MAFTICMGVASYASDIASFRPLGFSKDGSSFAFEEFGFQNGTVPYSNIFAIELNGNTFLPDTPLRLRGDDEKASLAALRAQGLNQLAKLMADKDFMDQPGEIAAFNAPGETIVDPHSLTYRAHAALPPVGGDYSLQLEELDEGAPAACKDVATTIKGFRLRFTKANGQAVDKIVYEDGHVPASRRCPIGYRLGAIITDPRPNGSSFQIALVLVMNASSDGTDGRWLAVPIKP